MRTLIAFSAFFLASCGSDSADKDNVSNITPTQKIESILETSASKIIRIDSSNNFYSDDQTRERENQNDDFVSIRLNEVENVLPTHFPDREFRSPSSLSSYEENEKGFCVENYIFDDTEDCFHANDDNIFVYESVLGASPNNPSSKLDGFVLLSNDTEILNISIVSEPENGSLYKEFVAVHLGSSDASCEDDNFSKDISGLWDYRVVTMNSPNSIESVQSGNLRCSEENDSCFGDGIQLSEFEIQRNGDRVTFEPEFEGYMSKIRAEIVSGNYPMSTLVSHPCSSSFGVLMCPDGSAISANLTEECVILHAFR